MNWYKISQKKTKEDEEFEQFKDDFKDALKQRTKKIDELLKNMNPGTIRSEPPLFKIKNMSAKKYAIEIFKDFKRKPEPQPDPYTRTLNVLDLIISRIYELRIDKGYDAYMYKDFWDFGMLY